MRRLKKNKYNRVKATLDGITFDSKLEAVVYLILKQDPTIKTIETQSKVYLTKAKILAKIDFKVETAEGLTKYVEAKGMNLATWNIKKRLWRHYGPETLEIYRGTHNKPYLAETIYPKGLNDT